MRNPSVSRQQDKLWSLDYVLNLLVGHFLFASYSALFTIVPLYVIHQGGETWHIGIVVGSFGVSGLLLRPYGGRWVYTLGAKKIAFAGLAIFAIGTFLHIVAVNVWLIIPARMLQGIGLGIGPVATATIVANLAPDRRRAEAMAHMGLAIGIASLYSPVLAFWLYSEFGFNVTFAYAGLFSVFGAILTLGISAARTDIPVIAASSNAKIPLISRGALFPTFVFLSFTVSTAPVNSFLPLLAEDRELGNPGLYFSVYAFTQIFVMMFSGTMADRFGNARVIVPGLLLAGAGMFLLWGAQNRLMFLSAALLAGIGFGFIQPAMQSLTINRVPTRERSSALATLQSAWDIGGSGGSFIIGPLAGVVGIAITFGMAGGATVFGALGFIMGDRRNPTVPRTDD
ncbi:MAG: MFS transporter, partial [SAR202 cluster bacterium]|nr:MFS transporter [SAR202 cluster bacterium]